MDKKQIILQNLAINYYFKLQESSNLNLIFLHGWRSEGKVWKDVIESLNYNCYALDLPGFGESQIPNKAFTLADFSEVVNEFVEKLKFENVILIGHSNGGAIAIKFLTSEKSATKSVSKLILVDSAGIRKSSTEKSIKNSIAKILKPIFQLKFMQPLRKRIYISMGSEDYISEPKLKQTYLNMISEDLSSILKNINIPTLLIWGNKDKATPISDGEFMNNQIKNSELKIIERTEHFSFLQNKELFIEDLNNFLK